MNRRIHIPDLDGPAWQRIREFYRYKPARLFVDRTSIHKYEEYVAAWADYLSAQGLPVQFTLPLGKLDQKEMFIIMPKKSDRNKSTKTVGEWNGIANVSFSASDKDSMLAATESPDEVLSDIHDLAANDYKLSISYDTRSDCPMASLSCYNPDSPNYKFTMISRAPDVWTLLRVVVYKHYVVAQENWGASTENDVWG